MKLQFIKPGTTVEGTISSVEVANRGAHSFLEIAWLAEGQTIRESHFMTNYDEIVEAINNNSSEYVKIIDNETIINNSYKLNSNTYFMEKITVPHAKQLKTVAETFIGVQYTSKQ